MYPGPVFGSEKTDNDKILNSDKNIVCTMDICDAKSTTNEDKAKIIIATDCEKENTDICDYLIRDPGTVGLIEIIKLLD